MLEKILNTSLKPYNTFGLNAHAKELIICPDIDSIKEAIKYVNAHDKNYLVLGGGSNILFAQNYEGTIIHPTLSAVNKVKEDSNHVWVEAQAGMEWDQLVDYTVNNGWCGLENLSYIPGNVGASPVQNIGAYGVEAKDCITEVKGFFLESGEAFCLKNKDCQFAYRQSIFKQELKSKTIITSVVFKLNRKMIFNLSYGPVKNIVEQNGEVNLTNIRNTIIEIRKSKLPEPEELGNAGSFFKNPVVANAVYENIKRQHDQVPSYTIDEHHIKIPAGWLIEQSGWKGKSLGEAAVHEKQALVLVNKGKACGQDLINLSKEIIKDVKDRFGIALEPEVNIV